MVRRFACIQDMYCRYRPTFKPDERGSGYDERGMAPISKASSNSELRTMI
jgi:hypothetical protein